MRRDFNQPHEQLNFVIVVMRKLYEKGFLREMGIIEKAGEYIKQGKVKLIGKNINQMTIQVGDKLVMIKKKAGRTLLMTGFRWNGSVSK